MSEADLAPDAAEPRDSLRDYRERLRATEVPWFYRPWLHAALTLGIVGLVMVALATRLHDVRPLEWRASPAFFVMNPVLEYMEHRYLLHKRLAVSRVSVWISYA